MCKLAPNKIQLKNQKYFIFFFYVQSIFVLNHFPQKQNGGPKISIMDIKIISRLKYSFETRVHVENTGAD